MTPRVPRSGSRPTGRKASTSREPAELTAERGPDARKTGILNLQGQIEARNLVYDYLRSSFCGRYCSIQNLRGSSRPGELIVADRFSVALSTGAVHAFLLLSISITLFYTDYGIR